ncbi:hypothetical protein [Glutamicibacter creatinolyticus]|uniref:hypothetical protein n=1 Tax=Glutamicibacter creatinolyticus TaxID=162496 RepID=UPI0031CE4A69
MTPRKNRPDPHRARVFKDEYSRPVWQVYYGKHWVGSAHSVIVAHEAATLAVWHANQVCEHNVTSLYLIQQVTRTISHREFWEPAAAFYTHITWRERMAEPTVYILAS